MAVGSGDKFLGPNPLSCKSVPLAGFVACLAFTFSLSLSLSLSPSGLEAWNGDNERE